MRTSAQMPSVEKIADSMEALRRRIAVLFQDPVHYHASVRENIAFGDIEGLRTYP